jgi:hypothetical protein
VKGLMMNQKKEYISFLATPGETQKKIRTWMSSGYDIEIIYQKYDFNSGILITNLFRESKK